MTWEKETGDGEGNPLKDIEMAGDIYISPSTDTVVVWLSTGKQQEEILARAIAKSLGKAR